jgi:hypothetical protein
MSYAFPHKRLVPDYPKSSSPRFGQTADFIRTHYESEFSEGTKVQIWMRNYDKDPIQSGEVIRLDHMAIILIVK